jgi:hypothetical protein
MLTDRLAMVPDSSILESRKKHSRLGVSGHLLLAGVALLFTASALGQGMGSPATVGQWQILANKLTINPVHAAVMHNGRVLMIWGYQGNPLAAVWDPATQSATAFAASYDMFCNGMVVLPDGRPLVIGGTLHFGYPYTGLNQSAVYNPTTGKFTNQASMADGRWYPTGTVLSNGTVMTFGGDDENDETNNTVEIFTANAGTGSWSTPVKANWVPPLYPRLHLLPNGTVFYSGITDESRFYNPATQTWTKCCTTNFGATRNQDTSVLLPLRPSNNYNPTVMIMGGSSSDTAPATNTTEIINLSAATPKWVYGPNMSQPRIHLNSTILPTGNILVTGGEEYSENTSTASFNADLYHPNAGDPAYNTFTSAGANSVPRAYHSNAILLPDATVILTGSNPPNVKYEDRVELYQPAYLFNSNGTLASRPVISGVPTGSIGYNSAFAVETPNAANIQQVVLMRPGAPTHAFDMEQRLVGLTFTSNSGVLTVTSPPNSNIAPPGYYMLFILNKSGVPSVAQWVQLCPPSGCL